MSSRLLVLAALVACGDNLEGLDLADFDEAANAARCEHLVRCGLFGDVGSCAIHFRRRPDRDLAAAIAAGTVIYDPVSAKRCHDALARTSCDLTSRAARVRPPECDRMFAGTIATGDACSFDEECGSGACNLPACTDNESCCVGACRPANAPLDEPCESSVECVADAYCGDDHRCHPLEAMGGRCRVDGDCDYGLACIGATELMAGACRDLPPIGEMCPYQRCEQIGATCAASACVALGLPGAACTTDTACSPFARCDTNAGACAAIPQLGMPCEGVCAGEAWCDVDGSMTCLAPLENLTPCTSHDQCASLYCHQGVAFDQCTDPLVCF